MNAPTCGGLFDGAGLLAFGLHLAGWEHRWLCEVDEWRRELLRTRFGVPVYDDIRTLRGGFAADAERDSVREQPVAVSGRGGTSVTGRAGEATADADEPRADAYAAAGGSWGAVGERTLAASPVDLIAGGFPCKGGSTAGKRGGFEHAETVLWFEMRRVIREVRPRYVLIENVANLLGMAASPGEPAGSLWGTVLGDLAALGFGRIVWDCIPAAAIGAPHLRDRVFAVASHPERMAGSQGLALDRGPEAVDQPRALQRPERPDRAHSDAAHTDRQGSQGHGRTKRVRAKVAGTDGDDHRVATHADERQLRARRNGSGADGVQADTRGVAVDWGDYRPAIDRWAAIHGPAPEPLIRRLDDGDAKLRRVRARVDRSRLSALGDGVHVYVGWLAGAYVMELERERLNASRQAA